MRFRKDGIDSPPKPPQEGGMLDGGAGGAVLITALHNRCEKHQTENTMPKDLISSPVKRRTILKAGLAIGSMQVVSPFVVKSLADEPIKIGLDNPLTGVYAALGKNELIGCQLALDQINAK